MGRVLAALLVLSSPQDRADLPREIDTWYLVFQGKEAVGYVHERVRHAARPSGYEYLLESEIHFETHSEELSFSASLDETLTPTECSADAHVNGAPSGFVMYTRDDRRLEAHPSKGDPILWTQPGRDDFHLLPGLTLYALRQNDTVAKEGRVTLRAVDPRGRERDGIEVVLEVGAPVRREYRGREAQVVPVAFLKPFPAASRETELREAFVDRYGRIVEARMAGGAHLVIVDHQLEALAAVGSVRRQGRRDIFDKLTAMRNAARERERIRRGEPAIERPAPTRDTLMSDFEAARKMADEIRVHRAAGRLEEAGKTYLKMLVHLQTIRGVAAKVRPELLPEIEQARGDAELAWPGAARVQDEARLEFVRVKRQMDALEVEAMAATHQSLQRFRDRIEVEGRPERKAIDDWAAEVGTLVVKCRARRELGSARLEVSGITLGEIETTETVDAPFLSFEVPFVRPFAEAEINGRVYRRGDTIQGTRIRVDRITRHGVQVWLRDEVRDVPLR